MTASLYCGDKVGVIKFQEYSSVTALCQAIKGGMCISLFGVIRKQRV